MVVYSCFINLCFTIFHRLSIGLKSGVFLAHSNNFTRFAWKNFCICFELWRVALSCWNIPSLCGQKLFRVGSKCAFKRLSCLVQFIILSIGCTLPSPAALKLAQNISFGTCRSSCLIWPFLPLTCPNVSKLITSPCAICFVWKQDFVLIFYYQVFVFAFSSLSLHYISQNLFFSEVFEPVSQPQAAFVWRKNLRLTPLTFPNPALGLLLFFGPWCCCLKSVHHPFWESSFSTQICLL